MKLALHRFFVLQTIHIYIFFPVSRTASGESGQNMMDCAAAGA